MAARKPTVPDDTIDSLSAMDKPENLELLKELGELAAARQVKPEHFAPHLDFTT